MAQDIIQRYDMGGRKFQEEFKDVFRLPLTGDMFITIVEKSDGVYFCHSTFNFTNIQHYFESI